MKERRSGGLQNEFGALDALILVTLEKRVGGKKGEKVLSKKLVFLLKRNDEDVIKKIIIFYKAFNAGSVQIVTEFVASPCNITAPQCHSKQVHENVAKLLGEADFQCYLNSSQSTSLKPNQQTERFLY